MAAELNANHHALSADLDSVELEPVVLYPGAPERGMRLDRFLAHRFPERSRTFLQRVLADQRVLVDQIVRQQTFRVTPGQVVTVEFPGPETTGLEPEPMALDIVFEDQDVLVINKPAGLVVHPAPGHPTGTLVNGLIHYLPDLNLAGSNRPGIVHRLDKDTSGLMVVAKSDAGHASLIRQWADRTVDKRYLALVNGVVDVNGGTIDAPIGRSPGDRQRMAAQTAGKASVSHFTVLERFREATMVEIELVTGRTHQIRVHMAFIGHPVAGDSTYNRASGPFGGTASLAPRQFLHASLLAFKLPGNERVTTFESPLPGDLANVLQLLRDQTRAAFPHD